MIYCNGQTFRLTCDCVWDESPSVSIWGLGPKSRVAFLCSSRKAQPAEESGASLLRGRIRDIGNSWELVSFRPRGDLHPHLALAIRRPECIRRPGTIRSRGSRAPHGVDPSCLSRTVAHSGFRAFKLGCPT